MADDNVHEIKPNTVSGRTGNLTGIADGDNTPVIADELILDYHHRPPVLYPKITYVKEEVV